MNWFEQVSEYIGDNLSDFISHFFPESSPFDNHKGVMLNPSPCCGHNDCFSLAKDKPVGHCFSCGTKGTYIQLVEKVWGIEAGRAELGKWSGKPFGNRGYESDEEKEKRENNARLQKIYNLAVNFYHLQLFSEDRVADQALEKQLGTDLLKGERSHTEEVLREFQVGLSLNNFDKFNEQLRRHGFTDDELDAAAKMIKIPPYNYVYPYFDKQGNLVRFNTKKFIRRCMGKKKAGGGFTFDCNHQLYDTSKKARTEHEEATGHTMERDGFSTGDKDDVFYTHPEQRPKKYAVLVEGENDVISVYEEINKIGGPLARDYAVVGIGGGIAEGHFQSPFLRQFSKIYEAFDNDDAGDKYREQLAKELPDISTYHIEIDKDFDDIDSFLKAPMKRMSLVDMLDHAQLVETKHIRIAREGAHSHIWHAKNRAFELVFEVEKYNFSKMQLDGALSIFKNGSLDNKLDGGLDRLRVDGGMNYAKIALSEYLTSYYHDVPWEKGEATRPFTELLDIVRFSKNREVVIRQLAWYLFKADGEKEYNRLFRTLNTKVKSQQTIAEVLKEVNGFQNEDIDLNGLFPKINLSQYFNVTNNDGYFYFSRLVRDGETPKLVPCLISNRKEEIRLDLMKRKDPQCLLLIQNKYEMPYEVETAIMDSIDTSLQPYWVDKWKNGEIDQEEMNPSKIIQEIEDFIAKCYYLDISTRKVLSLWIYSTYFYMLFKSGFPYLLFTGPKGTGKSTLDTIVALLSLNAKLALDISESALYRSITFEGGTFILDEVENLMDKRTVDSNGYAKILKGGYSDIASVYRTNMDKGGQSEKFSVFGPKVISNINGIEDVIADRCIFVRTFRISEDKLRGLTDPQIYRDEKRQFVHSITSRAALSALTNFDKVSSLFHDTDSNMQTGNARLSQILRPLMAMARFVGGDYEEHLMKFYHSEVKSVKEEISTTTTEGMIRKVLERISKEFWDLEKEKWATDSFQHAYTKPITFASHSSTFEVDTLHMKVLCEEMNGGEPIDLKLINSTMKAVLGTSYRSDVWKETTATVSDEGLQRALGGKRQIRVKRYLLDTKDFLKPEQMNVVKYAESETDTMF